MQEYHKIETIFKRDEKNKKLIIGAYNNPAVEYLKDEIWQFTEKVDGTNIRVYWDGHSVHIGGRTDRAEIPKHLLNRLTELFCGEVNEQMFEQKFGGKEVMLFGEGYGVKIQNGGGYRNDVDFILFDVMVGDIYLSRANVEDIGRYFGIDVVPVVLEGTIEDGIAYIKVARPSIIAKNGALMEGVVGRPKVELLSANKRRIICKIKYCDFKE